MLLRLERGIQTAMMSRQKLLFAENDQQVMETLGMYLESVECQPVFVGDGREILEKLSDTDGEPEYRAVVLDTRIREMDIHQMIRRIRENSAVPIIILAPESEVADRILALNLGADDFMTEPVNPMEFAVRVRVAIRRFTGGSRSVARSGEIAEKRNCGKRGFSDNWPSDAGYKDAHPVQGRYGDQSDSHRVQDHVSADERAGENLQQGGSLHAHE